jgi:hypothetical protein
MQAVNHPEGHPVETEQVTGGASSWMFFFPFFSLHGLPKADDKETVRPKKVYLYFCTNPYLVFVSALSY